MDTEHWRAPLAVVPAGHPLAGAGHVPLTALPPEPYIQTCPGLDIDSTRFFAHRSGERLFAVH